MKSNPLLPLLPLLLLACAPNSEIPSAQTERSIVTVQTTFGEAGQAMELTREANIQSTALDADVDEAWAALPPVFEALELPITGADGKSRLLSTVKRLRRIGGKSLASYFHCPGPYGNLASSGDVYVSIQAQILPAEGGTGSLLRTLVDAQARSSTSGSSVQCSSRDSLQRVIAESLVTRLAEL
jgi:hypothetical protein